VDTTSIRARLQGLGWHLLELPVRSGDRIVRWKVVASRGDQSYEINGTTLDEAVMSIGQTLGVIPRN